MAYEITPLSPGRTVILFDDWKEFGEAMEELVMSLGLINRTTKWTINIRDGPGSMPVGPFEVPQLDQYANAILFTAGSDDNP